MKLKNLLKIIDPVIEVAIWTSEDRTAPAYTGSLLDIPWTYLNYKIGRPDKTDVDQPLIVIDKMSEKNPRAGLIINLLPPRK